MKKIQLTLILLLLFGVSVYAQKNIYRTFGTTGKELLVLKKEKEAELFSYTGRGALTHMWFGGDFKGWQQTKIRVYVDGEVVPSIDMEIFLGHGIGFNDPDAPWETARMGKTGSPSGVYNTFRIPFGSHIRVTRQLNANADDTQPFWWIIRGTENLPITIGGIQLPDQARLKLYKIENKEFEPLQEFDMCNVKGDGSLYLVTMEAKGLRVTVDTNEQKWKDLSFLESCVRAYIGGNSEPLILSSGLEDYFLGTYYFNKGKYHNPIAGLTHLDTEKNEFSAYRFHEDDPVFFNNGLRLTNRIGEMVGNRVVGNPPRTTYTTYVWLYQW